MEESLQTLSRGDGTAPSRVTSWINKNYNAYMNTPHGRTLAGDFSSAAMLLGFEKNLRGDGLCASVWILGDCFKRVSVQEVTLTNGHTIKVDAFAPDDLSENDELIFGTLNFSEDFDYGAEDIEARDEEASIEASTGDLSNIVEDQEMTCFLERVLSENLVPEEFDVLVSVFGLIGHDPQDIPSISKIMKVSESDIEAIYEKALQKLERAFAELGMSKEVLLYGQRPETGGLSYQ